MAFKDELLAEAVEETVKLLAKSGTQIHFDFPEKVLRMQSTWPADCPLSEDELREELRSALEEAKRLGDKMKALAERLPESPEDKLIGDTPQDSTDDFPGSVYEQLAYVAIYIFDEVVPMIESTVTNALAATPESLRADWMNRQIPESIAELLRQVVPEAQQYGWTKDD